MTRYFLIRTHIPNPRDQFDLAAFMPWINCNPDDNTAGLAIHKWMREAGYLSPRYGTPREPIDLDVWQYDDKTPRHPNGNPQIVHYMRVALTPTTP